MNLTDIDLSKATPIDFDDIREGDTVVWTRDREVAVLPVRTVTGLGGNLAGGTHTSFSDAPEVSWFLLDRPTPPRVEPGTTGTATVGGVKGVRVMRVEKFAEDRDDYWIAATRVDGYVTAHESQVTDFVADPAPGIPQDLRDALDRLQSAFDGTGNITGYVQAVLDTYAKYEATS